jgi:hypothetical protein
MTSEVKRTDLVDAIKKIQTHMCRPLPQTRYEKWTEVAQFWQRLLNHWPEDEPTRWYGGVEQTLERDLRRIKEESEVND